MNDLFAATKVKKVINECQLHQKRMEHALNKLQKFMPLTVLQYEQLKEDLIDLKTIKVSSRLSDNTGFSNIIQQD